MTRRSAPDARSGRGRPAQSMVEAMVAITIIISSVSSAMTLVTSSITATTKGGAQVVAANLAREGLEVVRAARDTNWLKSQGFSLGLIDLSVPPSKTARPLLNLSTGAWTLSFAAIPPASNAVFVTTDGVYVQADAQPANTAVSPYTRTITLQHICRDNASGVERIVGGTLTCTSGTETLVGILAGSNVGWKGVGGKIQNLTVEERFYDWR